MKKNNQKFAPEERDFLNKYGKNLSAMQIADASRCPSADQLQLFYQRQLSETEQAEIEMHVDHCPVCAGVIQQLVLADQTNYTDETANEIWHDVESALDAQFATSLRQSAAHPAKPAPNRVRVFLTRLADSSKHWRWSPVLAYAGAVAVLVIGSAYTFFYLNRPAYVDLALLQQEKFTAYRTTSSQALPFQEGIHALDQRDFNEAITRFSAAARFKPESYAAHYYLSIAYLFHSEQKLPGLVYAFNPGDVDSAIVHLTTALRLAGNNMYYLEDCYWILGKAYLRLGRIEAARHQFETILALNSSNLSRQEAAKEMLRKI